MSHPLASSRLLDTRNGVPIFVEEGLHGGDGTYTLAYSAFSAGGLRGAPLGQACHCEHPDRRRRRCVPRGCHACPVSCPRRRPCLRGGGRGWSRQRRIHDGDDAVAQIRTEPHLTGRVLAIQTV